MVELVAVGRVLEPAVVELMEKLTAVGLMMELTAVGGTVVLAAPG